MKLTEVLGGLYVMITEEENDLILKFFPEPSMHAWFGLFTSIIVQLPVFLLPPKIILLLLADPSLSNVIPSAVSNGSSPKFFTILITSFKVPH